MAIKQDARWHPEMLTVLEMIEEGRARALEASAGQPYAAQRAIINEATRFARDNAPEMASVEELWLPALGRQVRCRLYRPSDVTEASPVVVYLHGGGWTTGSLDTHDKFCRDIASVSGWTVLAVDYALSPEAVFPQAMNEVYDIVAHLRREGLGLGLDASRMVLSGDSAGGNLALGCALYMRDRGVLPVSGVVAAYPVCDCDFETPSYLEYGEGCYLTRALMETFWEWYTPDLVDRYHPYAAPLRGNLRDLPPSLLLMAAMDPLCSEGEKLATALLDAGNHCQSVTYSGVGHAFMSHANRISAGREAFGALGEWLGSLSGSGYSKQPRQLQPV